MRAALSIALLVVAGCSQSEAPPDNRPVSEAPSERNAARPPAPAPSPSGVRSSRFTKLDEKACKTTYRDEETGDWSGLCPGLGDIQLELSSGDLRDDLEIIQGDSKAQLGIPTIVANGAFNSIGETLEWRGPVGRAPDVLVARVLVAKPDGTSDSGRLTIVRLGEKPCIVAVVQPQKEQSDKARAIADGKLPACLTPEQ